MTPDRTDVAGITAGRLRQTHEAVSGLLTEIAMHFKGHPKITLLVRHPEMEAQGKDADFVLSSDTLEAAIESLQRRQAAHLTQEQSL